MEVVIDCYGVTARLAGGAAHALRLAPGARIKDALELLAARSADLARLLPNCACAIGDAVVPRTRVLDPGERVALLPPVSGG